jgi:nucleoside-diphosphate-sugar epimerase
MMQARSSEDLEGKVAVITGVAGFIGSWMAESLCASGAHVIGVDNLTTGSEKNLESLAGMKNFRFTHGDIAAPDFLEKGQDGVGGLFEPGLKIDYVLHLASRPSPDDYTKNQIETLKVNSLGTLGMLELARSHGATFLFSSTSEIYGDSELVPTPETYFGKVNPMGEMSSYKESKRFSESLCMAYCRTYNMQVRIARIFNSYGPRIDPTSDYDRVIARFMKQAITNQAITVHGDGTQSRSFCYITDTVEGLKRLLLSKEANGLAVNIGSEKETKVLELAEIVRRVARSKSEITFIRSRPDDTFRRCPDISRARRILQWEPVVSLEEGLSVTFEWFRALSSTVVAERGSA